MKVLNNALAHSTGQLAIQAIRTGLDLGLDPASVVDVLRSGGAQSFSLHNLVTRLVPDPEFVEHAAAMMAKDLDLFISVRDRAGLEPTEIEKLAVARAEDPAPAFLVEAIGHAQRTAYSQIPSEPV